MARSLEELGYDLSLSSLAGLVAWRLKKLKKPLPDFFIPEGAGGGHKM